jgi:hypothetical protein
MLLSCKKVLVDTDSTRIQTIDNRNIETVGVNVVVMFVVTCCCPSVLF